MSLESTLPRYVIERRLYCVRVLCSGRHRNAAAYNDEVPAPARERSNGYSGWWYMYTLKMISTVVNHSVQRERAADTVCCDRQSLCAGFDVQRCCLRTFWVITSLHLRFRSRGLDSWQSRQRSTHLSGCFYTLNAASICIKRS